MPESPALFSDVRQRRAPQIVTPKLAIALTCRDAMREYRKGKPIASQVRSRP